MAKRRKADHSEKLSQLIVKGMQEKKATGIVVMDLRKVRNAVADFFVICSGNSDKQLDAIADSIDDEVYKKMRRYSEVKWSEFVRKCVQKRVEELDSITSNVYADEHLLAKNWLSKEDEVAWKNL